MRIARRRVFVLLFAVIAALATGVAAEDKSPKIKVLIVTGFDVASHMWNETTQLTVATLEKAGKFDVKVSEDKEDFASPALSKYDVVVLNFGFWKEADPSEAAKKGLLDYVKSGKGLVALHFACSSFQEWDEYATLLGRVWKKGVGGHGPYGEFTVKIKSADHPITNGLKDFKTEDELYAKLTGDAKIDVLATAFSDWSGKVEPIVFTKRYGKGRVVQNVLGHGLDARHNQNFKALVVRCVEYAATGKVTAE